MPETIQSNRQQLYASVTEKIVTALDTVQGNFSLPWHQQSLGPARNIVSRKPYRGINQILLWLMTRTAGYRSSEWGTFAQWKSRGQFVRKGEKSSTIIFWKSILRNEELEDEPLGAAASRSPILARAYSVFNASQIQGYTPPFVPQLSESERQRRPDGFFAGLQADVRHGGDQACYALDIDAISLPDFSRFKDAGGYYATRAHETVHWSGAAHRLDRDLSGRFGSDAYAMEELVAELGAAFLCAELGLQAEPRPDHAHYIASWLTVLRQDESAIFTAASKAQQAADRLMQTSGLPPLAAPVLPPAQRTERHSVAQRSWVRGSGPRGLYV